MRHLRRYIILAVGALALVLATVACGGGDDSGNVPSNAVAKVGDQTVTKADFDRLLNQARVNYRDNKRKFPEPGTEEYIQLRDQIIKYLVLRAQYAKEAGSRGIEISDDQVNKRLDQLVQQYFQGDKKKYEQQLKANGVSDDQVRSDIEAQLIQEELFKDVTKDVQVSDAELRKYYESNKKSYSTPAHRDIRHILLKKNQKALADSLATQLRGGSNFAQLARKYSQDPGSKKTGGQLEISKGQTVPPFDKVAFSIPTHKISDPVRTQYGWHVIEAVSPVKRASTTPFAQVKEAIRQQLLQSKKSEASQKYVQRLEKSEDVAYQVGFTPRKTNTTANR